MWERPFTEHMAQEMRLEAAQGRDGKLNGNQQGGVQGDQGAAKEQGGQEAEGAAMARDRDEKGTAARLRAAGERQKQQQPQPKVAASGVDQKARYHVIPRWEHLHKAPCKS